MILLNWAIHKLLKPDLCYDYNPNKLVNSTNDFAKNQPTIFFVYSLNFRFNKYDYKPNATFINK